MSSRVSLRVSLERAQLTTPLRLQLIEEGPNPNQRGGLQFEQPDTRVVGDTFVGDDTRHQQDLQMSAHRRLRHAGHLGQFARTMGASAEKLHHAPSSWVGQRLKYIHYRLIVNDLVTTVKAGQRAAQITRPNRPRAARAVHKVRSRRPTKSRHYDPRTCPPTSTAPPVHHPRWRDHRPTTPQCPTSPR